MRGKGDKNYNTESRAELMARSKKLGMGLHSYEKTQWVKALKPFLRLQLSRRQCA